MSAAKFSLSFTDGREIEVTRRPIHLVRAERIVDSDAGANEALLAMLWAADTGGIGSYDDFEAWMDTVENWERLLDAPAGEAPEVPPAQGGSLG